MVKPGIDHKTSGYSFLLLTLFVLHLLKPAVMDSRPSGSTDEGHLFIQVEGDVKVPAVYAFKHLPTLMELIKRAGGLMPDSARPEKLKNLILSSGMTVTIDHEGDESRIYRGDMSAFYKTTLGLPISVNRESEMGLSAVPGIGLGLAKAIVEERSKRGGFKSLDELLLVNGIGEKLYGKIRAYLTL